MRRRTNTAFVVALGLALAAVPAFAEPAQDPTAPPVASLPFPTPAPNPPPTVPVTAPEATLDSKQAVGPQPQNTNGVALFFLTIMNSGGAGRYGR